ncbi:hypothetical protein IPA_09755 [Ignicoccus pacificus DSM 13166]|uniref:Uncharacterized protein n=1 Tax=Ignicoccus pacificus DSM 13166 TaxID=940294 RepID=A0A977PLD4_9CREN|nr:hypothetical protein IPA_09755 [Ignicoccus pacificus DSM 13166]
MGVYAKMKAAAEKGYKYFLIPFGENVTFLSKVKEVNTPFGVIQSISKIKVNLIEEGKKLGIKVIPVATIFDALKYWVPNPPKIPKPFVAEDLPAALKSTLENWLNYYLKLYEEYKYETRGLTDISVNLLERASEFAHEALKLSKTQPYQAVNMAFTAALYAEKAYWIDQVTLHGFQAILTLGTEAQKYSKESMKIVMGNMTYDPNKLDVLMTAASRALKSYYYYHAALNSTNIDDVITYLVYSKYYSLATRTWLELLKVVPSAPRSLMISEITFNKTADALYSSANGILGYLLAMNIPVDKNLETAIAIYKIASDKPAIFRMAASMYFIASASYTLHTNYSISLENVLKKSSLTASYALSLALSRGLEPYVSLLYDYSANKLKTTFPLDALFFFEFAAMHSYVLYTLS